MWPVKFGIILIRLEILILENADFQFPPKERITPNHLFKTSTLPLDLSGVGVPSNPDTYLASRQSKLARQSNMASSTKQMQMVASV